MEQRIIKVLVDNGEIREFEDTEKGNRDCIKYLTALKKTHETQPFFSSAPWKQFLPDKVRYGHKSSDGRSFQRSRDRLDAQLRESGTPRPLPLNVCFEAYLRPVSNKQPLKRKESVKLSTLLAKISSSLDENGLVNLLEKLADPAKREVAVKAIELYEMIYS